MSLLYVLIAFANGWAYCNLKTENFSGFIGCLWTYFLSEGLGRSKGCKLYAHSRVRCLFSAPLQCQQCAMLANVSLEMEFANANKREQQYTDCRSFNAHHCH